MRILLIPLFLSACASPGYEQYLAANQAVAVSRSNADTARFNALASIAKTGDSAASVAAAMALAMGGNASQNLPDTPLPVGTLLCSTAWGSSCHEAHWPFV